MKFRPCIDLHNGKVKQIVGSTLTGNDEALATNFVSSKPSSYYADLYKQDELTGGHIIKLGSGCEDAALEALHTYPGGMQIGGGITAENARFWLEQGASEIIVTSYVFQNGQVDGERLRSLVSLVGKDRLVLDLSCRKKGDDYFIVTDRWQKFTDVVINEASLAYFAKYCKEFLIHAADVEGKCAGVAEDLAMNLGRWAPVPTTYAGGVKNMADLYKVREITNDTIDVTIGSALDIFGGSGVTYVEAVAFNNAGLER